MQVYQRIEVKKGIAGAPRLKGRVRKPFIQAPIKKVVSDPISPEAPVYLQEEYIKPIIEQLIEEPIKRLIEDIIPPYVGEPDEQPKKVPEGDVAVPATTQSLPTIRPAETTEDPL